MFFILSKTVYYLVMPVMWILALLLWAILTRKAKRRRILLISAFTLLLFFSNQAIINELIKAWERPVVSMSDVGVFDVGIILTGVTDVYKQPKDRVYFKAGADRVLHPVQLYKEGKLKKILVSGGGGDINKEKFNEARNLEKVLLMCGVKQGDIILEENSLNTHDNAVNTAQILKATFPDQKYLLITSAFHMRRAEACFEKAGINTKAFPVAFYATDLPNTIDKWLGPSESAIYLWGILFHEILGFFVYKVMGYA